MKRLSLQWRITLMSVLLIGITCVAMNLLLCSSGVYYMDTIADSLQGGGTVILNDGGAASFDPQLIAPNEELTIVVDGVQGRFRTTNWYITAAVTLLSGILAYFVSGRALKPLRSFTSQVEQVQLNNLADMRIDEDAISEFRQLSRSFNQMLERLNNAFSAQRQFTGNAAHELRTPLALMQAQLELFSAEHPDVRPEMAEFLTLLREQTERLIQMTRTLLEMSNLRQVARNERIQLAPMIEEIFTDLAPLSDKLGVTLTAEGDGIMTGSDALIYRLIFNLTENAVKYNRPGGSVRVSVTQELEKLLLRVSDTGFGIPEVYQRSIFQPFFRVDKSRSREYGGAGLGLSLVWEIADLHGGSVWVEKSSEKGTTIAVGLPTQQSTKPYKPFYSFFAALRLPPCGVPLCMGRSAGKRSVPFQSQIPCSPCPGLRPSACRRQGVCGCMRSAWFLRSVLWVRMKMVGSFSSKQISVVFSCLVSPVLIGLSFLRLCHAITIL